MDKFDYVRSECTKQLAGVDGLLGVILLGSISAGMDDETSDYDIQIIVSDEAMAKHPEYADTDIRMDRKVDCWTSTLSELRAYDRHGYDVRELLHAMYPIDPDGIVKAAVDELVHYPEEELPPLISARLDSYYDGVFRSLKCFRKGFTFGAHQMAARSMEFFIETIWAVNGLVMPFVNRAPYLLHTLEKLPFSAEETRECMEKIAAEGDIPTQLKLLDRMFEFMEELGYKQVLTDWEGVLEAEADLHRNEKERI